MMNDRRQCGEEHPSSVRIHQSSFLFLTTGSLTVREICSPKCLFEETLPGTNHCLLESMKSRLRLLLFGGAMLAIGCLVRSGQGGIADRSGNGKDIQRQSTKVYEVIEAKKHRRDLDSQIITVAGAVYAGPGKEFYLIQDDELSMRPDNLPPNKAVEWGIRLPDWRLRDLELGTIYCRIAVTGRFEAVAPSFDSIAPIHSVSWRPDIPPQRKTPEGEADAHR